MKKVIELLMRDLRKYFGKDRLAGIEVERVPVVDDFVVRSVTGGSRLSL